MSAEEKKRTIPSEGYMRLPAVVCVFPVSRSTWWAGISTGRFPKGAFSRQDEFSQDCLTPERLIGPPTSAL